MHTLLLKLRYYLHFVSCKILFVSQIYVLYMPIIKHKVIYIVIVNLSCFLHKIITWLIQILHNITLPLRVRKLHIIKPLNLHTHIIEHSLWRCDIYTIVPLTDEVLYKFSFKCRLSLVNRSCLCCS